MVVKEKTSTALAVVVTPGCTSPYHFTEVGHTTLSPAGTILRETNSEDAVDSRWRGIREGEGAGSAVEDEIEDVAVLHIARIGSAGICTSRASDHGLTVVFYDGAVDATVFHVQACS